MDVNTCNNIFVIIGIIILFIGVILIIVNITLDDNLFYMIFGIILIVIGLITIFYGIDIFKYFFKDRCNEDKFGDAINNIRNRNKNI